MNIPAQPIPPALDFINPKREMLVRDGEEPNFAVVAAVPNHSGLVTAALQQLNATLMMYMEPKQIILLLRDQIELTSGTVINLGPHSVFFSLSYPTAQSRIFEMELAPPVGTAIH